MVKQFMMMLVIVASSIITYSQPALLYQARFSAILTRHKTIQAIGIVVVTTRSFVIGNKETKISGDVIGYGHSPIGYYVRGRAAHGDVLIVIYSEMVLLEYRDQDRREMVKYVLAGPPGRKQGQLYNPRLWRRGFHSNP